MAPFHRLFVFCALLALVVSVVAAPAAVADDKKPKKCTTKANHPHSCGAGEVCIESTGECAHCPLITRGPLGAINGIGFGIDSVQEVVTATSALDCCQICANTVGNNKKDNFNGTCSGFAYESGNFCNLAIGPAPSGDCTAEELTYNDEAVDETIFTVGGAPCNGFQAIYGGCFRSCT